MDGEKFLALHRMQIGRKIMVSMVRLVWEVSRVEREFKRLLGYRKFWIRSEGLQWSEMKRRTKRFHASEWEIQRFKISGKFKIREWLESRKPLASKSNCELQTWGKISLVGEETQNASDETLLGQFEKFQGSHENANVSKDLQKMKDFR